MTHQARLAKTHDYIQRFKHRIMGDTFNVTFFVNAWTFKDVQTVLYDVLVWKSGILILEKRVDTLCEVLEIASQYIL